MIISRDQFERMRLSSMSDAAVAAAAVVPESEKRETGRQRKARLRTERMLALEATRQARIPLTEMERRAKATNEGLLEKANRQRNEDLDDVKKMRAMMNYAVAVTIRDEQVAEKKQSAGQWIVTRPGYSNPA